MSEEGKKIKVVVMIPALLMGGAERFCIELARTLDKSRYDVTLVSMWSEEWVSEGYRDAVAALDVPVEYLDLGPKRGGKLEKAALMLRRLSAVRKYVKENKPDVLHGNMSAAIYCAVAGFAAKTPVVVETVHGIEAGGRPSLYERVEYACFRRLGMAPVAISDAMRAELARRLRRPEGKIARIPNGVDLERFRRGAAPRPDGPTRFLFVGRLESVKNPMLALEAFLLARKENPDMTLTFVGGGSLRGALEERAGEAEGAIMFAGVVSDVAERMRGTDALIVSSDSEGLSLALIEGMACGLPVVSTRCGGPEDAVHDGENGFLVPVGDARAMAGRLLQLAASPDLMRKMSARAVQAASAFGLREMARRYEALYEEELEK